jgi:hypothetical protein
MRLSYGVDLRQFERLPRALRNAPARLRAELERSFVPKRKARILARMGNDAYPPERPGSTYDRTGELGRSWDIENLETDGLNATFDVTNDAAGPSGYYADYVVGKPQAWMHEGYWWQAEDKLDEMADEIADDYRAAYFAAFAAEAREGG